MNAKPLHNRVVVETLDTARESKGGIIIPDNVAEKPDRARVVAVGPGRRTADGDLIAMTVKPGDEVLFGRNSGHAVKIEGTVPSYCRRRHFCHCRIRRP